MTTKSNEKLGEIELKLVIKTDDYGNPYAELAEVVKVRMMTGDLDYIYEHDDLSIDEELSDELFAAMMDALSTRPNRKKSD